VPKWVPPSRRAYFSAVNVNVNGPLRTGGALGAGTDSTVDLRTSTTLGPATVRSRAGLAGVVGLLATGLLLCLAAPSTNSLLPQSVQPVPRELAGLFGITGIHLRAGELLAALTVMFIGYVLAVRHAERMSPQVVLTAIAAFVAIVVMAPPLFSTDVFSYQAYAKMFASYGANPYLTGPVHVLSLGGGQGDPLYSYVGAKWISTPSVYGPLFTLISAIWATVSVAASAFIFKGIAAVSCMVTLALMWHSARLRGLNPTRAVALFGLNPLVILYGIGGGHNDLLMVSLTTAGIYALLSHRERTTGVMIALGTAIKLTGGLLLPFALASGVELGAGKRRKAMLVGAAATSLVIAAAGFAAFGTGMLKLPFTLDQVQGEGAWQSVPGFITTVLRVGWLGHAVGLLLGFAFVAITARLVWRVWRRDLDWIDGLAWSTFMVLVSTSSLLPWYVTWLLPPVALCTQRRLWTVTMWFTGWLLLTTMLAYIPHGVAFLGI
jgi:alpha-1,6-mannosyltransferase